MLPLAVLAWDSNVTLHGALEERYVTTLAAKTESTLLSGVTALLNARAAKPEAAYEFTLAGGYFAAIPFQRAGEGLQMQSQLSGRLDATAGWQTSPHSTLSLKTSGLVASDLGLSAEQLTANPDPFARDRVQYSLANNFRFNIALSPRTSFTTGAGYSQSGALAAAVAEAAGIDTHSVQTDFAYSFDMTALDKLSAALGARYTHYTHAIVDTDLTRGALDAPSGTLVLHVSHDFSESWRGKAGAGAAVALEPMGSARSVTVSPAGGVELVYTGLRYDLSWGYDESRSSLGSRIGEGQSHAGWLGVTAWPMVGRGLRDLAIRGLARVSYGTTAVAPAADSSGASEPQQAAGTVRVWTAVAGIGVQCPLTRSIALTSGAHIEFLHMATDPAPSDARTVPMLRLTATAGISGILSTDPAASEGGRRSVK